jgi:hypothetical protein
MILIALVEIVDIKIIGIVIGISALIAIPLCILFWKYRERLFSNKMTAVMALTIPVALFFWKWMSAKSPTTMVLMGFVLDFLLLFMAFKFEEKYLK